jgi:hypothetical protein
MKPIVLLQRGFPTSLTGKMRRVDGAFLVVFAKAVVTGQEHTAPVINGAVVGGLPLSVSDIRFSFLPYVEIYMGLIFLW